ncbi:MAG: CYTH domain-containing protein [Bacteroidetes bacterium]|nr:CYTH domain-containing protein [Bacteroidota bacterium]
MLEIERKFLVRSEAFIQQATSNQIIAQGYLNSHPERTVRIRIAGERGIITVKGKGNTSGTTRFEWETEIALSDAIPLLKLCEAGVIHKKRYNIPAGRHCYEVDVFEGENRGLIIAEIELTEENEFFEKPEWLGTEVTGDERYYNAYLSQKPFKDWA